MLAYLDCFSGISGDMLLGALVDAGVEVDTLRAGLASLPVDGYQLRAEAVSQHGMRGTRVQVVLQKARSQPARGLADVEGILAAGGLTERVRSRAQAIFLRLAEAEAHVHGVAIGDVHFHEVGAVDAIVDVVGIVLGLERLGIESLYCSQLPLTSGRVRSEHGELPVPAPATLELLRGTPAVWQPLSTEGELVTPTGAAILASLARFERPGMRIERVGHGFGTRRLPWANCLRILVGAAPSAAPMAGRDFDTDVVAVIEANIDTMTGESMGWLMERLLAAGALDVSYAPLTMKKQRPGTRITVLAPVEAHTALAALILRESATLGVRIGEMRRLKARRRIERIETPLGSARIKLKLIGGQLVHIAAEYDDARALAAQWGMPLLDVSRQIEAAGWKRFARESEAPEPDGGGEVADRYGEA